jgi:hypothetical protein
LNGELVASSSNVEFRDVVQENLDIWNSEGLRRQQVGQMPCDGYRAAILGLAGLMTVLLPLLASTEA